MKLEQQVMHCRFSTIFGDEKDAFYLQTSSFELAVLFYNYLLCIYQLVLALFFVRLLNLFHKTQNKLLLLESREQ